MEIKGIFEVQGEEYSLFVENATRLTKVYLLKKKKESQCMEPILVKISAGTLKGEAYVSADAVKNEAG